jgi:hypothetical protein
MDKVHTPSNSERINSAHVYFFLFYDFSSVSLPLLSMQLKINLLYILLQNAHLIVHGPA